MYSIPQTGVRAAQDRLQKHARQLMHRSGQRRLWGAPESVLDSARASFAVARGRQLQEPAGAAWPTRQLISLRPPSALRSTRAVDMPREGLTRAARIFGSRRPSCPISWTVKRPPQYALARPPPGQRVDPKPLLYGVHFPGQESPQLRASARWPIRCRIAR